MRHVETDMHVIEALTSQFSLAHIAPRENDGHLWFLSMQPVSRQTRREIAKIIPGIEIVEPGHPHFAEFANVSPPEFAILQGFGVQPPESEQEDNL